jgi:hypothetical protein
MARDTRSIPAAFMAAAVTSGEAELMAAGVAAMVEEAEVATAVVAEAIKACVPSERRRLF